MLLVVLCVGVVGVGVGGDLFGGVVSSESVVATVSRVGVVWHGCKLLSWSSPGSCSVIL